MKWKLWWNHPMAKSTKGITARNKCVLCQTRKKFNVLNFCLYPFQLLPAISMMYFRPIADFWNCVLFSSEAFGFQRHPCIRYTSRLETDSNVLLNQKWLVLLTSTANGAIISTRLYAIATSRGQHRCGTSMKWRGRHHFKRDEIQLILGACHNSYSWNYDAMCYRHSGIVIPMARQIIVTTFIKLQTFKYYGYSKPKLTIEQI